MLEIRPNCELCDIDLPANSQDARICSYECTFCKDCVETVLANVCPNCGGGFTQRPIRPNKVYREGTSLKYHPVSSKRIISKYSKGEISTFCQMIKDIPPEYR